uniref:Ig-like domain-containing protein n=1 Tax=Flavobacterium sp. TaxID=239 RepID=UPI004049C995
MKKIYFIVLFFVFALVINLTSCAKRGTITGGLIDTIAPKIVNSNPENHKTNFSGKEIKINFNELIKVKEINKQLVISPPMKKTPIIIPQGSASKFISIKILDTLQENTTYSFNFGQSITDNNEGNPYSQFKYIFSTGNYIDSLSIIGKIKDAYNQKVENFVSVQLYNAATFTDSTVYKENPIYVTNTLDSLKTFALENLKGGKYYLIALKDINNNYKFDPNIDKIGFLKESISIPNDTLFELELFKEVNSFKARKPTQESNNKFFIATEGNTENIKITAKAIDKDLPIVVTKYPEKNKDSLQIFIQNTKLDSIVFTVENGSYSKSFTSKVRELKTTDSLSIDAGKKGILSFRENFTLLTSTPVSEIKKAKISLLNKDSIPVEFTVKHNVFDQEIVFDFKKEENEKYNLQLLPGAVKDFYLEENDTLNYSFNTKSFSDYGNLKVNLKKATRYPLILELINESGSVVATAIVTDDSSIAFDAIEPNIYTLRVIYDDNKNGVWDSGNYLEKLQAEQVQYYPKTIDVRANWDVEQEYILEY